MTTDTERAKSQAQAQLADILEMVKALNTEDDDAREEAQEAIQEGPLSVEVRSGWHTPGEKGEPEEYAILLCTGGPAVRLIGELDRGEPYNARLEYQDWFTEWERLPASREETDALIAYAQQFYFGD